MKIKTTADAHRYAEIITQKLGKHSAIAMIRSFGYKVEKTAKGYTVHDESGKCIGECKKDKLLYTLIMNGERFNGFLISSDPDYKSFFIQQNKSNALGKRSSDIEEYFTPINMKR